MTTTAAVTQILIDVKMAIAIVGLVTIFVGILLSFALYIGQQYISKAQRDTENLSKNYQENVEKSIDENFQHLKESFEELKKYHKEEFFNLLCRIEKLEKEIYQDCNIENMDNRVRNAERDILAIQAVIDQKMHEKMFYRRIDDKKQ